MYKRCITCCKLQHKAFQKHRNTFLDFFQLMNVCIIIAASVLVRPSTALNLYYKTDNMLHVPQDCSFRKRDAILSIFEFMPSSGCFLAETLVTSPGFVFVF